LHVYILLGITLIGSFIHVYMAHTDTVDTLLLYFLVVYYGLSGLFFASGHFFCRGTGSQRYRVGTGQPFPGGNRFCKFSVWNPRNYVYMVQRWILAGDWAGIFDSYAGSCCCPPKRFAQTR
jgi:hypothetical protein